MSAAIDTFLDRLEARGCGPQRNGTGWSARCPAHEDRHPSLAVNVTDDGTVLVKCHAGCEIGAIVGAMDLELKDLFPNNGRGAPVGMEKRPRDSAPRPPRAPSTPSSEAPESKVVAEYDYRDESGARLFQVVRYDPKDFKQRRIRRPGTGKGIWAYDLKGIPRPLPLYRLPELLATDPAATVFVAEGEKDVDNLRGLGLIATCNPMGAGKWQYADDKPLEGRNVVVVADLDEAGEKHVEDVAARQHGRAASVRILRLPLSEGGKDASDFIVERRGDGKDDAAIVREIIDLAAAAPEWEPAPGSRAMAPDTVGEPFGSGQESYRWLKETGKVWKSTEAGRFETAERILQWFERRGDETLTKPNGEKPREPVSYAGAMIFGSESEGTRRMMYQFRDWATSTKLLCTAVHTGDCVPAVHTLSERTLRPLSRLLAAGRHEDVPKAITLAQEKFRERVEIAKAKATFSRFPVRLPKAVSSRDVQGAVETLLPRLEPEVSPVGDMALDQADDWWPEFSRRLDATRAVPGIPGEVVALLERVHQFAVEMADKARRRTA